MIKVFDNIIDNFEQEIIKKYLFEQSSWSFVQDVSIKDNIHQKRPGFKLFFNDNHPLNIYLKNIILNTAKKVKIKKPKPIEIRSFLQLPLNENYVGKGVDTPHLDRTTPHTVFLYYVTDSDGDTIVYNYKSKSENDIPYFEDIRESKRIKPKQGRVVVFDGLYWHTAEQPTKDVRCIINFNIQ